MKMSRNSKLSSLRRRNCEQCPPNIGVEVSLDKQKSKLCPLLPMVLLMRSSLRTVDWVTTRILTVNLGFGSSKLRRKTTKCVVLTLRSSKNASKLLLMLKVPQKKPLTRGQKRSMVSKVRLEGSLVLRKVT